MTNSTITKRHNPTSESSTLTNNHQPEPKPKFAANINVAFSCNFSIPPTPEVAATRILKNLINFKAYYVIFICIVLSITLIPQRKLSLLLLLVNAHFSVVYLLLLKAFPSSELLRQCKWLVALLLLVATVVEMVVTEAERHLLFTLIGTIPAILMHAVVQTTEVYHVIQDQDHGASIDAV